MPECGSSCDTLPGALKDRCAIWHQLKLLVQSTELVGACEAFVQGVDVCRSTLPGLKVGCDMSSRVVSLSGLATLVLEDTVGPWRNCTATWGGTLAPSIGYMERLSRVDLSVPPRSMYLAGNQTLVSYREVVMSGACTGGLAWSGGNLTGIIPQEWALLNVTEVDMRGNQKLSGEVPIAWVNKVKILTTGGTQLADHLSCGLDCFGPDLTGAQRDRCGLWYQLRHMEMRREWLPHCEEFLLVDVCPRGWLQNILVECDPSGRVVNVTFHPVMEDDLGFIVHPVHKSEGDTAGGKCTAFYGGTLAPEMGALDSLLGLDLQTPPFLAYVRGTSRVDPTFMNCTAIHWEGTNMTGTIPHQWGRLTPSFINLSGNRRLTGQVPASWVPSARRVRTAGTQLVNHYSCSIDCFDPSLTGVQRDKCGLWYQLSRLEMTEEWLPPCEPYVFDSQPVCGRQGKPYMGSVRLQALCSGERVWAISFFPAYREPMGFPVFVKSPMRYPQCTAHYQGTLAPQLAALDQLRQLEVQPVTLMYRPPYFLLTGILVNCEVLHWFGDNITGTIPQEYDHLQLTGMFMMDNRKLSGRLPRSLLILKKKTDIAAYFGNTSVEWPTFSTAKKDQFCKASQRLKSELTIGGTNQTIIFGLNIPHSYYNQSLYGPYAFPAPQDFYCGKNPGAVAQAVSLWGVFLVLMVGSTYWKRWAWRRQQRRRRWPTVTPVRQGLVGLMLMAMGKVKAFVKPREALMYLIFSLYDLATDLLLAYAMYPSWTTYFIMGGFLMPDLICSTTVALHGMEVLKQHYPVPVAHLILPIFWLITVTTLPLVSLYLLAAKQFGWRRNFPGIWQYWLGLDPDRVVSLLSGVTACTEDVITTIITTVGFVLMATLPWKVQKTNLYFAVWTFWLSMVTSMVHMLVAWLDAVGLFLQHGNVSWVRGAFVNVRSPSSMQGAVQGGPQVPTQSALSKSPTLAAPPPAVQLRGGRRLRRSPAVRSVIEGSTLQESVMTKPVPETSEQQEHPEVDPEVDPALMAAAPHGGVGGWEGEVVISW